MTDEQIEQRAQKIRNETIDQMIEEKPRITVVSMIRIAQRALGMGLKDAKLFVEERCAIANYDERNAFREDRRAEIKARKEGAS